MIEWKQAVDDQFIKLQYVNISDMHFETKPPNLMTINFSCYTVWRETLVVEKFGELSAKVPLAK